MRFYDTQEISQKKRDQGFVAAVVFDVLDPEDSKGLEEFTTARENGQPLLVNDRLYIVSESDLSEIFNTILFGLKPLPP